MIVEELHAVGGAVRARCRHHRKPAVPFHPDILKNRVCPRNQDHGTGVSLHHPATDLNEGGSARVDYRSNSRVVVNPYILYFVSVRLIAGRACPPVVKEEDCSRPCLTLNIRVADQIAVTVPRSAGEMEERVEIARSVAQVLNVVKDGRPEPGQLDRRSVGA